MLTERHGSSRSLLLSGELLAERWRTDDLMPVLCLPPSRVDPKVLGLNVVIYHSQPCRWILDDQEVSANQVVVAARRL